jgi:hypothetical protein
MLKVLRRGSTRYLALSAVLLTVLLCLYYANYNGTATDNTTVVTSSVSASLTSGVAVDARREDDAPARANQERAPEADILEPEPDAVITPDTCPVIPSAKTDVDTVEQFKTFEFQVRVLPSVFGVKSHCLRHVFDVKIRGWSYGNNPTVALLSFNMSQYSRGDFFP